MSDATTDHVAENPTIYATLMNEAFADAHSKENWAMGVGGMDEVIETFVSPANIKSVQAAIHSALFEVYRRGLDHGYVQALQAIDARNGVRP